jgi:hypothetical protein
VFMFISSFMMLFSSFIHYSCFPSPFIILLLFYPYALSYLLLLFVDPNIFIALFTFVMLLWIYYCDFPLPVCFSTANIE